MTDQANFPAINTESVQMLARKSWTAYVRAIFQGVITLGIAGYIFYLLPVVGLIVILLALLLLITNIFTIKSFKLFMNDSGVWYERGIFPWNKGIEGVKWRDMDEAVYFQDIWSWLFKSYTLRVGHRFTKEREVLLGNMGHGNEAVKTINTKHAELISQKQIN